MQQNFSFLFLHFGCFFYNLSLTVVWCCEFSLSVGTASKNPLPVCLYFGWFDLIWFAMVLVVSGLLLWFCDNRSMDISRLLIQFNVLICTGRLCLFLQRCVFANKRKSERFMIYIFSPAVVFLVRIASVHFPSVDIMTELLHFVFIYYQ